MKFLFSVIVFNLFQLFIVVVNCRNALWDRVNGREMNARDLVGLANDHEGLDFDINAHKHVGLSSTNGNILSLGAEKNKHVVVDGVTHDNENIRIQENHVNKLKLSPLSRRNLIHGQGPIEYENSKTTNLQIGEHLIEKRDEDKIGKTLTDTANRAIVQAQEKLIKKSLKFIIKNFFD